MKEFGDNHLKRITRFFYKWLWCYLVHRKQRCWPCGPIYWHCEKCHKCGEEIDIAFRTSKFKFRYL